VTNRKASADVEELVAYPFISKIQKIEFMVGNPIATIENKTSPRGKQGAR